MTPQPDDGRRRPGRGSRAYSDEEDSDLDWSDLRSTRRGQLSPALRSSLAIFAVLLGIGVVFVGGSLVPAQSASRPQGDAPLVGRTSSVCAVTEQSAGPIPQPDQSAQPATTTISAVAIRQAPDRVGALTGAPLTGGDPLLSVTNQGFGAQIKAPPSSILLQGVGVMATASSGATLTAASSGELTGLMAAPCTTPATSHWFVGVGAEDAHRTELVLSNPDDAQAEVDLRFFGANGMVVVPGSPGLVVPAHSIRTIALAPLVNQTGPLSVWVRATNGRVAAMARDLYSVQLDAAGADWHPASVSPVTSLVIPAVPAGQGGRDLMVVNPGSQRALVNVSVLSVQGALSPAGAAQIEVAPESTATVSLAAGLAGQAAGVQLQSDQPVSASVVSTSARVDATTGSAALPDISIQPAQPAIGGTGVSAIASTDAGDAELVLSNGSDTDAQVTFEELSLDGVMLHSDQMFVAARSTSTRRLTATPPSYLVVHLPAGPDVFGAVDFDEPDGPVAGLATLVIGSPDVASRARVAAADPSVGR